MEAGRAAVWCWTGERGQVSVGAHAPDGRFNGSGLSREKSAEQRSRSCTYESLCVVQLHAHHSGQAAQQTASRSRLGNAISPHQRID